MKLYPYPIDIDGPHISTARATWRAWLRGVGCAAAASAALGFALGLMAGWGGGVMTSSNPKIEALAMQNRVIVLHLRKVGVSDFEELYTLFGHDELADPKTNKLRFRKRMAYLLFVGLLENAPGGHWGNPCYSAAPEGKPAGEVVRRAKARALQSPPSDLQRVPPRQIDLMHAPVYVPPSTTPTRPGALAFLQLPSRGFAC